MPRPSTMADISQPLAFEAPAAEELTRILAGYDVDSLIAVGGMGAVYSATQISLDRPVAIKVLPKQLGADPAYREQFQTEAKAMARLNHPNLVGVYDFGNVDGLLYIVMELVDGNSLFHAAHGIAIDASESIRVVKAICHGLHHAHENGVLHRDIKPSNILLDLRSQPKIADFGLAQPVKQEKSHDQDKEIMGTPHYTAPEIISGLAAVDARSDIFSIGVILHELLTGHVPAHDPRTASAISHCDPRLDAVIRKATATNPDLRYRSAMEMATELETIETTPAPRVMRTANAPGRALSVNRRPTTAVPQIQRQRQIQGQALSHRPRLASPPPSSSSGLGWIVWILLIAIILAMLFLVTRNAG